MFCAATAFVAFSVENPGGSELLSGAGFDAGTHPEFQEARRRLIDVRVPLGLELAAAHQAALDLVGALYALANGYAALAARDTERRHREERIAVYSERVRRGSLALIAGWDA